MTKNIWTGVGDTHDITTDPLSIPVNDDGDYTYNVSIINTGSADIRVMKVGDAELFEDIEGVIAAGMVVPAGQQYNSYSLQNEKRVRQIFGVVIATDSGTSTAVVNFE